MAKIEDKKRSIQFRRNVLDIYDSSDKVKEAIEQKIDTYHDGEQIFGRYTYTETKEDGTTETKISTLIGLVYVHTDNNGHRDVTITYVDNKDIENHFIQIENTIYELSAQTKEDIEALSGKSVGWVEAEQLTSGKTHQYTIDDADLYEISATTLSGHTEVDTFQLTFTPYSPSGLTVPTTIGDIEKGTEASELNGETLSKVLDDIIFPTKYPIITYPSSSLVFTDTNNANTKTVKIGTQYYGLKTTYNKGKSTINDGVSPAKFYNGNYISDAITVKFSGGSTSNTSVAATYMSTPTTPTFAYATGSSTVVTAATNTTPAGYASAYITATTANKMDKLGTYKFISTISYSAGDTLITSKNSNPGSPLRYETLNGTANNAQAPYKTITNPNPANTIATSETCQVNVTLPIYATVGATITTNTSSVVPTKEVVMENTTLLPWGTQGNANSGGWTITLPTTTNTDGNRRIILTPRKLSGIYIPNLAGELKTQSIGDYAMSTDVTVNGYTYYQYRWNGGNAGTINARITWA